MAGYYRRFIEGFSKIARPMTALLANKVEFKWTQKCQDWSGKREVDYNTYLIHAWCSQAILSVLWCFLHWVGMCANARRESHCVFISTAEGPWEELSHAWLGISSSGSCIENMEALFIWEEVWCLHGPQESKVYLHPVRVEYEERRWLELIEDYELEIHYHLGKANGVADALNRKSQVNMMAAHPMSYELPRSLTDWASDFWTAPREW